ncbi:zf-HC2 domain-containing protein [Desulfoscipio gibsoniae]|uniref:Anti-sigma-W factor RsiW n=1 Tax=Desulfoscipio gibsoniae DSM 7213 TaxID=767817 RepID=R4KPE6_9FIRM|nr:zf-HC2 domain-containing protein [Desulfoscipio gibsoniae]AGL02465.1 hypothetical protein Desgi_3100 [Desulfoscipio gibsoniae DSM 7213]
MCNTEVLQSFLDGELEPAEADAVRLHLAGCPDCRQELSRLRLLWLELELEKDEEIEIPMELPFIRQQAIASTRVDRPRAGESKGTGLWDAQRLAWQPALTGVSLIPGSRQLMRLAKATGSGLPTVIRGVSSLWGTIASRRRDRS